MAAVVEVKFYNSFLLRKTVTLEEAPAKPEIRWNGSMGIPKNIPGAFPIYTDATNPPVLKDKCWVIRISYRRWL